MLPWYVVRHIALSKYIYLHVPNPKIHQIVLLKWRNTKFAEQFQNQSDTSQIVVIWKYMHGRSRS